MRFSLGIQGRRLLKVAVHHIEDGLMPGTDHPVAAQGAFRQGAFRFVCEAHIAGIDANALPPGSPVPGSVHYISRLTPDRQRHEVTVSIQPLMKWERIQ